MIVYLNLLVLEGMSLLLLEFVFVQPPRKGEEVSVENACRESSQMTFKCTGEEEHDSQRLCQSKPLGNEKNQQNQERSLTLISESHQEL